MLDTADTLYLTSCDKWLCMCCYGSDRGNLPVECRQIPLIRNL